MENHPVTVIVGVQWGDEGKGKLVDILAQEVDIVARYQGGSNAGHTVVVGDQKFDFHLLPSGFTSPHCISVIGNGMVVHLPSLFKELETLDSKGVHWQGRLFISDRAHLVFDFHQIIDGLKELELGLTCIGTTKKGIGPAYSSKASRSGLRVHHLFQFQEFECRFRQCVANRQKRYGAFEYDVEKELARYKSYIPKLRPMVLDTVKYLHDALQSNHLLLIEGANGVMLDIDHGTYPYVTSSNASVSGVCTGLGIPPRMIGTVIGVCKAYTTRVGDGPFPTELHDEIGSFLQNHGQEYGVTTGRRRRCGWLDLVVVRYAHRMNHFDCLCLTKLDVLDGLEEIKMAVGYEIDLGLLSTDMRQVVLNCYTQTSLSKAFTLQEDPQTDSHKHDPSDPCPSSSSPTTILLTNTFPADLHLLQHVRVLYETFPGWKESISHCRCFEELPMNAQNYILRIQELTAIPIRWIGVGPDRKSMVQIL